MINDVSSILYSLLIGCLSYLAIVTLLRLSGKRTLSKWNAFDFVVTIAYGSILATMVLSQQTSLLQGIVGIGVLLLVQFGLTWVAVRSPNVQTWIKAQPRLLLLNGKPLTNALKQERVTEGEIRAAVRAAGISALEDVAAIVLETDGSFSLIQAINSRSDSVLCDVRGYQRQ